MPRRGERLNHPHSWRLFFPKRRPETATDNQRSLVIEWNQSTQAIQTTAVFLVYLGIFPFYSHISCNKKLHHCDRIPYAIPYRVGPAQSAGGLFRVKTTRIVAGSHGEFVHQLLHLLGIAYAMVHHPYWDIIQPTSTNINQLYIYSLWDELEI